MSKLLKYLVFLVSGLIVFALALVFILFVVIDPNRYRPAIESVVASQSDLQLQIAGDISWTFRPVFGLSIQDVRLSNGVTPQELASFSNVALRLDPSSLMRGQLDIQEFVADGLHVNWIIDANGQSNWLREAPQNTTNTAQTDIPVDINIRQITVTNTRLDYQDNLQGIFSTVQIPSLISRNTNVNGRPFDVEMSMQVIDQVASRTLDMSLQSSIAFDYQQGTAQLNNLQFTMSPLVISGSASASNFPDNLRWQADLSSNTFNLSYLLENFMRIDEAAMPPPDAQQVTVQSLKLNGDAAGLTLEELLLGLNDSAIELRGDLLYPTDTRKMLIGYELQGGSITIDDWLNQPETQTPVADGADNNTAPIDTPLPLEMLADFDLRGNHSLESVTYAGMNLAPVNFSAQLQRGTLNLDARQIGFYEGTIDANLVVDASTQPAQINLNSELQNISAAALTRDKERLGFFTGRFNANTNHSLQGNSVFALRDSISGAAQVQVADSSVDITLVKRVFSAISVLNPQGDMASQWPDVVRFNNVDALLMFNNGIRENQELSVRLDNFDVAGTGGIDLDNGSFDYRLSFTFLGEPAPQSIRINEDYQNIPWPVRCEAAFSDPGLQYCSPDLQQVRDVFARMARDEIERRATDVITEQVDRLRDRVRNLFQD